MLSRALHTLARAAPRMLFVRAPSGAAASMTAASAAASSMSVRAALPCVTVAPRVSLLAPSSLPAWSAALRRGAGGMDAGWRHVQTAAAVRAHAAAAMCTSAAASHASTASVSSAAAAAAAAPRWVAPWLYVCAGSVFCMVVLGGVTRLTGSGLSMVDWNLYGRMPPRTQQEWEAEFEKYKQFPEFQIAKRDMTLDGFKSIFFWEYTHRQFGRGIGALFALPTFYLLARRQVSGPLAARLVGIGLLLGGQGLLGWYMVKSGLARETMPETGEPRVSPYRLSAHLMLAVGIYAGMLWTALSLHQGAQLVSRVPPVRFSASLVAAATATTMLSGAFVAGNRAGLVYNEFPLMGGRFVPEQYLQMSPAWRNFTENLGTVQFNHRWLGITTMLGVMHVFFKSRRRGYSGPLRYALPAMLLVAWAQVGLGISTLLTFVPVPLATMHQAGSLTLLGSLLWVLRNLVRSPLI